MSDPLTRTVFLGHLATTLFMTGVIWFVQVVHYPLFAGIGVQAFPAYEQQHTRFTAWVVGPPMLVELASAVLLVWYRPCAVPVWQVWTGLVLIAVIWLSTGFVLVPCHERLSSGFDPALHHRLVRANGTRTAAWTLRAVLALWMTGASLY